MYREALKALCGEYISVMSGLSLTLTTGWVRHSADIFSVGSCVELVHVLLLYRTDITLVKTSNGQGVGVGESEKTLNALFGILRDVLCGTDNRSNGRIHRDKGEGDISPVLPGGRSLGQHHISAPISLSTTANVLEVLNIIETILSSSEGRIVESCVELLSQLQQSSPSGNGHGQGGVVQDRLDLLISQLPGPPTTTNGRVPQKLPQRSTGTTLPLAHLSRMRKPLLTAISNPLQSEFSLYSPQASELVRGGYSGDEGSEGGGDDMRVMTPRSGGRGEGVQCVSTTDSSLHGYLS